MKGSHCPIAPFPNRPDACNAPDGPVVTLFERPNQVSISNLCGTSAGCQLQFRRSLFGVVAEAGQAGRDAPAAAPVVDAAPWQGACTPGRSNQRSRSVKSVALSPPVC